MNDRELLELAALAVGFGECIWNEPVFSFEGGPKLTDGGLWDYVSGHPLFNPLVDDGQALRLAVKLSIQICPPVIDTANCYHHKLHGGQRLSSVVSDGDHYAATRRAVTIAAAVIGKAMKGEKQ